MSLVSVSQAELKDELNRFFGQLAARLVDEGTPRHRRALETIADSLSTSSPGAAAALVDWTGAEVVRLRAFGVAHGTVVGRMGEPAQRRLLRRLRGVDARLAA